MVSSIASFWNWYAGVLGRTRWRRKAIFEVAGIVCLTLFGPFGTYVTLGFFQRVIFWTIALSGIGALMHLVIWPMLHARRLATWPRLGVVALGAALAAIPGTALIVVLHPWLQGSSLAASTLPILWGMVALMGTLIASIQFWEEVFGTVRPTKSAGPVPAKTLPPALRGELVSITMQDHYLEVTTRAGATLQAMRFSDALQALATIPGQRIHRSHWVSASGLEKIVRDGGKPFAILTDGRRLPISRPYLAAARAMLAAAAADGNPDAAANGEVHRI